MIIMTAEDTGILFIGHGSRLPYNKEVVTQVAAKYQERYPDYNIDIGFMELVEPNIPTAFNKLKEKGVNKIIVNPVFLANGMHTRVDIPTILGIKTKELEEIENHGHLHHHHHDHEHGHHHHHHHGREAKSEPVDFDGEIVYLKPIGDDDKIVEIIAQRINTELEKDPQANTENTGILLIGHGSTLEYNNMVVESIANKFITNSDDYEIQTGFMQLSEPSISQAAAKFSENIKKIIAVPIFLAEGVHTKIDIPLALGLEAEEVENYTIPNKQRDTIDFTGEVVFTKPLGADDIIVDIIDEKIKQHL